MSTIRILRNSLQAKPIIVQTLVFLLLGQFSSSQVLAQRSPSDVQEIQAKAEKGDANSQRLLGSHYYLGVGVSQSYVEAAKWFRMAAEQGNASGQVALGGCYEKGRGVSKDYVEAVKWFRLAAEQGNPDAQRRLGDCYDKGRGLSRDYVEARKWIRKAAEQDDIVAQIALGYLCQEGRGGEKDYVEAYAWWNLAGKSGIGNGEHAASSRDELERKMNPQQVAEAQKRTKELRAMIDAKLKGGSK